MRVGPLQNFDFDHSFIIEPQMLLHCGPILFLPSTTLVPMNVVANGTFGLVDTGERKLMVTCRHVWSEFLELQKTNGAAILAVLLGENRPVLLPAIEPIDCDGSLDLATFDMEPFLVSCGCRQFYPLGRNGIPPLRRKDALAILGYLGEARQLSTAGANFAYEFLGVSVADISGFSACVDVTKMQRSSETDGSALAPAHSLGGLSGSPCYRLMRHASLRLVGFVTSSVLGLLRFTHVGCLNRDGTLNREFLVERVLT